MPTKRIRGRRRKDRNARIRVHNPICKCPGCPECLATAPVNAKIGVACLRPTTEIDHRVALGNGGTEARTNLQPLCSECHGYKTAQEAKERAGNRTPATGIDGWPA